MTPAGSQTHSSMACPLLKTSPQASGAATVLLGSLLLPQTLGIFCNTCLHQRPLGDILAVSFLHGFFRE